jgi:hypothetical protein
VLDDQRGERRWGIAIFGHLGPLELGCLPRSDEYVHLTADDVDSVLGEEEHSLLDRRGGEEELGARGGDVADGGDRGGLQTLHDGLAVSEVEEEESVWGRGEVLLPVVALWHVLDGLHLHQVLPSQQLVIHPSDVEREWRLCVEADVVVEEEWAGGGDVVGWRGAVEVVVVEEGGGLVSEGDVKCLRDTLAEGGKQPDGFLLVSFETFFFFFSFFFAAATATPGRVSPGLLLVIGSCRCH